MFNTTTSRYILRIVVVAALAGLGALKASIGNGLDSEEAVDLVLVTLGAAAAYAGIGAAVPAVEPFVGNKYEGAEVPAETTVPVEE